MFVHLLYLGSNTSYEILALPLFYMAVNRLMLAKVSCLCMLNLLWLLFPFFQQFGISLATTRNPQFFLVSIDFRWLYPIKKKPGFASAVQDLNSSSRDLEPLRREVHLSDDELWRAALQDNSCDICATYFLFFSKSFGTFLLPSPIPWFLGNQ